MNLIFVRGSIKLNNTSSGCILWICNKQTWYEWGTLSNAFLFSKVHIKTKHEQHEEKYNSLFKIYIPNIN